MEVVDACSALLSNREVLELLKNNSKTTASKKHINLATVLYETTSYLESCPQSIANLELFLQAIRDKQYNLTKFEKIQIANLKPENETELHLIVDNIEERFTEEQRNDILVLIQEKLNTPSIANEDNNRKKIKL